jgi:hypothetical protein
MATGKGRKGSRRAQGSGRAAGRSSARRPASLSITAVVRDAVASGRELLGADDPLEAELWASGLLGLFYKADLPLDARLKLERAVGPELVERAEKRADAVGLAVLRALAAVAGDDLAAGAAAQRLAAQGIPEPGWAAVVGGPEFLSAWAAADPYDEEVGYSLTFRYEGHSPHTFMALYDEGLGGIIKDASVGRFAADADPRALFERRADDGVRVGDVDGAVAAARIARAIATGDRFLENHWTPDFKEVRALLLARTRLLPAAASAAASGVESPEALAREFLADPLTPDLAATRAIVDQCLIARCEHGEGDPLRWSPAVVELFMLDHLPRTAALSVDEARAVPEVLTAWVRFALTRRGLEERWIVETEDTIRELAAEFVGAMGAPQSFDPAQAATAALLAAGIDPSDHLAVDAWLAGLAVPPDERERLLKGFSDS